MYLNEKVAERGSFFGTMSFVAVRIDGAGADTLEACEVKERFVA